MNAKALRIVSEFLGKEIISHTALSGGDICKAYKIVCEQETYFLKYLEGVKSFDLLEKEYRGLKTLEDTKTVAIPEAFGICKIDDNKTGLILAFLKPELTKNANSQLEFGRKLAQLHQSPASYFGLDYSNYIGTLDQDNKSSKSFSDFFWYSRLWPQAQLAFKKNLFDVQELKRFENLKNKLELVIPEEKPALIHGDLWSGNHLQSQGKVYMFDPSISYSHREVDLSMMDLFGGFDSRILDAYNEVYPIESGFNDRKDLYQLYYLLVHLNLFGRSYKDSVTTIVSRYI